MNQMFIQGPYIVKEPVRCESEHFSDMRTIEKLRKWP